MSKFEQTLANYGLTVQSVSNGLKKSIKEYKDAEKELNGLKSDFESADDEAKEEIGTEIREYEELLDEADVSLSKKIEDYIEKKPYYDAKLQHMKDKAAGKDAGASPKKSSFVGATGTTNVSAATGAVTVSANSTPLTGNTTTISQPSGEPAQVVEEEKKSNNWILWGFLGVVGLLVGVNVMKNRE